MRTLPNISEEFKRLVRVREYLNFTINSLGEKKEKVYSISAECQKECESPLVLEPHEMLELESRVYAFIDGAISNIDFVEGVDQHPPLKDARLCQC